MAISATKGFDHFSRGEFLPEKSGQVASVNFDYFSRGELFPAMVGANTVSTVRSGDMLLLGVGR